ncbi:septum formation inhibitor [Vibrio cholerae]|nr:septum formation inhibitor [Vibrio cholerae]
MISIAGRYWLSDQIESQFWQQRVMLSMTDESLYLETLTI